VKKVKPIGTGHTFNKIADTEGTHVSLKNFNDIKVDP